MEQRLINSGRPARCGGVGFAWAVLVAVLGLAPAADSAPEPTTTPERGQLTLVVPAPPGGSFEQTAIAMRAALVGRGLARDVTIVSRPGGGGLVGLSEFVDARRGDPNVLLVGGVGIIYSAKVTGSQVTPLDTTPVARLTRDYYAVAVPERSPLRNAGDLLRTLRSRPYDLHWAGDQPQGVAERLVWSFAAAANVAPIAQPYSPRFGAGQVAEFLQHGDRDLVGVAGLGELAPAVASGGIRILGVAAPGKTFGGEPTLQSQGLDIVSANWRGVFAPPGISTQQRERLIAMVTAMVRTSVWRATLRRNGWEDDFLAGDGFGAFVAEEQQRVFADNLSEGGAPGPAPPPSAAPATATQPWRWTGLVVAMLAAALAAALALLAWRALRARRRQRLVRASLAPIERRDGEDPAAASGSAVAAAIDREFDAWKLSGAERDVAWFLLKGLSMKEIARLRGASERTVRQQARSVYGKAGLDGRSDLSAHILDQCLSPMAGPAPSPSG